MMWMPLLSKLLPAGSLWKKLLPLLLALAVAATCYRAGYLNRDGKAKTEMAAVAAAHQHSWRRNAPTAPNWPKWRRSGRNGLILPRANP